MRLWFLLMLTIGALVSAVPAQANVDIQYVLPTTTCATEGCFVTGISDTPLDSVPGYGLVTLTGATAAQIVWPIPSGCSTGMPAWSRVTDPSGVTVAGAGLALRPGLIFFSTTSPLLTGCHQVSSWKQPRELMNQSIITSIPDGGVVGALNYHFGWYYARCTGAETNANCISWKTNLDQMVTAYPSRGQGITASGQVATLVTETMAFKAAQCLANPGGPFC